MRSWPVVKPDCPSVRRLFPSFGNQCYWPIDPYEWFPILAGRSQNGARKSQGKICGPCLSDCKRGSSSFLLPSPSLAPLPHPSFRSAGSDCPTGSSRSRVLLVTSYPELTSPAPLLLSLLPPIGGRRASFFALAPAQPQPCPTTSSPSRSSSYAPSLTLSRLRSPPDSPLPADRTPNQSRSTSRQARARPN